jgi:hypothetical protein
MITILRQSGEIETYEPEEVIVRDTEEGEEIEILDTGEIIPVTHHGCQ